MDRARKRHARGSEDTALVIFSLIAAAGFAWGWFAQSLLGSF